MTPKFTAPLLERTYNKVIHYINSKRLDVKLFYNEITFKLHYIIRTIFYKHEECRILKNLIKTYYPNIFIGHDHDANMEISAAIHIINRAIEDDVNVYGKPIHYDIFNRPNIYLK